MTQNTEQNVRTREAQVEALTRRMRWDAKQEARAFIEKAEARGAREAVLKMAFSTEQKAIEERKAGKRGEAFWRLCLVNALIDPEGWYNEEARSYIDLLISEFKEAGAEEQRRKDGEYGTVVGWVDPKAPAWRNIGFGDQFVGKASRVRTEIFTTPVFLGSPNVAALEAEIASLKEAEQFARADAEASKAREEALEGTLKEALKRLSNDPWENCASTHCERAEKCCSPSECGGTGKPGAIRILRAALTREGGV